MISLKISFILMLIVNIKSQRIFYEAEERSLKLKSSYKIDNILKSSNVVNYANCLKMCTENRFCFTGEYIGGGLNECSLYAKEITKSSDIEAGNASIHVFYKKGKQYKKYFFYF
jgi:hypothetical protein